MTPRAGQRLMLSAAGVCLSLGLGGSALAADPGAAAFEAQFVRTCAATRPADPVLAALSVSGYAEFCECEARVLAKSYRTGATTSAPAVRAAMSACADALPARWSKESPDTAERRIPAANIAVLAKTLSAQTPLFPEPTTRLDRYAAGPGRKLTEHYTLLKRTTADTPPDLIASLRGSITTDVCGRMGLVMASNVAVALAYTGADGKPLGEVVVTPKECAPVWANQ